MRFLVPPDHSGDQRISPARRMYYIKSQASVTKALSRCATRLLGSTKPIHFSYADCSNAAANLNRDKTATHI